MANRLVIQVFATVALLAAVPLQGQTPQSTWKSYPYPADGFAISAPNQPGYTSQTLATDAGNVEKHIYSIPLGNNGLVMIFSAEAKGLEHASTDNRLQKGKLEALKAGDATLTTEKKISLGPYPGLQFEAANRDVHLLVREYIVRNRVFTVLEVSPLTTPFPADAERIASSFKLLN